MTDDRHAPDPAGRLRLPALEPELESAVYQAFGGATHFDALIPCLEFRLKGGGRVAKPYHWLGEVEYDPAGGLVLTFTDGVVHVRGRNLAGLFTAVCDQQARWVQEADRATAMGVPDGEAVVEAVERRPSRR